MLSRFELFLAPRLKDVVLTLVVGLLLLLLVIIKFHKKRSDEISAMINMLNAMASDFERVDNGGSQRRQRFRLEKTKQLFHLNSFE